MEGISGSIEKRAEAVFAGLPPEAQSVFDETLWSLVTVSPDAEAVRRARPASRARRRDAARDSAARSRRRTISYRRPRWRSTHREPRTRGAAALVAAGAEVGE